MPFYLRSFKIAGRSFSFASLLWFLLAVVALFIQTKKGPGGYNNYLIFKGVFSHTIQQLNLYSAYPAEYGDTNHYGPFFSIIIAPFALLPNFIGCFLWGILNAFVLFYAIKKLPASNVNKNIILLIAAVEMMTSMHSLQFNPMLTGWIILSYVFVQEKKDFWAALFIAAGILTKLYGIVGLAFFLFSENKSTFILSFIFWMAVLFALPMLISSPSFIIQSYKDWYLSLAEKNDINSESIMQGMTVMRIIKKVFLVPQLPDIAVLGTAALFYILPLFRIKQLKEKFFQLSYLAFLLIGLVIFSSSAESPTFVIAMAGVAIWFVIQNQKSPWIIALLIFALLLTTFSTTDLFPKFIKVQYIRPYGLKALPCFCIWLVLAYQLLTTKFTAVKLKA